MVRGIQRFQEHFKDHVHQYVLIGGAACDLIMQEAALPFRGTKDLDIVLCVEVLDKAFGETFWEFIRAGKYKVQQWLGHASIQTTAMYDKRDHRPEDSPTFKVRY